MEVATRPTRGLEEFLKLTTKERAMRGKHQIIGGDITRVKGGLPDESTHYKMVMDDHEITFVIMAMDNGIVSLQCEDGSLLKMTWVQLMEFRPVPANRDLYAKDLGFN